MIVINVHLFLAFFPKMDSLNSNNRIYVLHFPQFALLQVSHFSNDGDFSFRTIDGAVEEAVVECQKPPLRFVHLLRPPLDIQRQLKHSKRVPSLLFSHLMIFPPHITFLPR